MQKLLSASIFVFTLLAALQLDAPAYAYLDPGTGAMLLQLLFGGVAGALVIVKLYWARFRAIFIRGTNTHDDRGDALRS